MLAASSLTNDSTERGGNPSDMAPSRTGYSGPPIEKGSSSARGGGDYDSPSRPGKMPQNNNLMNELANAIGSPRNYSSASDDNYRGGGAAVSPRGYRPPASVKMGGGTQGHDKVNYSLKGPQVAKVQTPVVYQLHCKDETKTNHVDIEGDIFEVEITNTADGETAKGKVERERKGVFKVTVRGTKVGKYTFNIWVKGAYEKKPIFGQAVGLELIAGDVIVKEEMNFFVTGWGMHGGTVGKPLAFEINVKDPNGQPMDCDISRLLVILTQNDRKVTAYSHKIAPGRFQADFTPPGTGEWIVCVEYGGQEVCRAAVEFNVAIDAKETEVVDPPKDVLVGKQYTFTIQAKGAGGVPITTGGEKFDLACSGPKGGVTGLVIRDELTGKYTVRFTLTVAGTYKFFISHKGNELKGVPLEITAK